MAVDLGQVFTKKIIADYMVDLFTLPKGSQVLDPCFGEGVFIQSLCEQNKYCVSGCEVDNKLFESAKEQFPKVKLYHEDFLFKHCKKSYDGIIINPPYIRQEKIDELEIYGITKEKLQRDTRFKHLPRQSNLYMYFIIAALNMLKPKGEMIVIFPGSWLKSNIGSSFSELINRHASIVRILNVKGEPFETKALVDVIIMKVIKTEKINKCETFDLSIYNSKLVETKIEKVELERTLPIEFSVYGDVKRGTTTGNNEMFINPVGIDIESQFLKEIISSPKQVSGYSTDDALKDKLLVIRENDILNSDVKAYLERWEQIILQNNKPKSLRDKICEGKKWYCVTPVNSEGIWFSYFVRSNIKFIRNNYNVLARDNFYIIYPKVDKNLLFALLNNYYTYYQLEKLGKKYGSGLLKLQTYDINNLRFIDLTRVNDLDKIRLINCAKKLYENNNQSEIDEITKILSYYTQVSYEKISSIYESALEKRLGESL